MNLQPHNLIDLLALVGKHARSVQRATHLPNGVMLPQVNLCAVCCAPISHSFRFCYKCNAFEKQWGDELADQVIPLSYAVKNCQHLQQFYFDLHAYKRQKADRSNTAFRRLLALALLFKQKHWSCIETAVNQKVTMLVTVPSTRNREFYPLNDIVQQLAAPNLRVVPAMFRSPEPLAAHTTDLYPEAFEFAAQLTGHTIIVDDTWVSGRNAQSVAVAAKRAGASRVSIVVLARMLAYQSDTTNKHPETDVFVDILKKEHSYNPNVCPVSGLLH